MRILSEQDRLEMLVQLEKDKDKLIQELAKFPMIVETQRLKKRKGDLEQQILQVEDAIQLFSKKTVFVPIEPERDE
jgi:hypothetical protein